MLLAKMQFTLQYRLISRQRLMSLQRAVFPVPRWVNRSYGEIMGDIVVIIPACLDMQDAGQMGVPG